MVRVEMYAVYIFPLTGCRYFPYLAANGWRCNDPSRRYYGGGRSRAAISVPSMGAWECSIWRTIDSRKDWPSWVNPWRGIKSGDLRLRALFLNWSPTPWLSAVICQGVKTLRRLPGSSDFYWSRKRLYRELVVVPLRIHSRSGSAFRRKRFAPSGIGRQVWGFWTTPSSRSPSGLQRDALPLSDWAFKARLADLPDCFCWCRGVEETVEYTFYNSERVRRFWSHVGKWTARIDPKKLVLLDIGYIKNSVEASWKGEKRRVFLAILAVVRMLVWTTRKKGLYEGANFSDRDLIFFFRHQLRVKFKCDRKKIWTA